MHIWFPRNDHWPESVAWCGAAETVSVQIIDTGIGIPQRDIQKLGRPFEQVENQFTKSKGILDEAQNTTAPQMKMFLTRFGMRSRMVICGDPNQTDLPPGATSGLNDAVAKLEGIPKLSMIRFSSADVVRHPLVGRIVQAYEGPGS